MATDLNTLPDHILQILRSEAKGYIKNNAEDVAALGEDRVKAILLDEVFKINPQLIPPPVPNASAEYLAERETILAERDRVAQLVAKAQLEDSERVERLKKNAVGVAGSIAGALGGVLISGAKVLIGI